MSCNCGKCNKNCPTIASGDCKNLKRVTPLMIDDHITAAGGLDPCSPSFCKDVLQWAVNQAKNTSCVLKNFANQICSLWNSIRCIDNKTRIATRIITLWDGSENIFDLPSMTVNGNLPDFDYLDLHFRFGTERVVGRVSLEGGIANFATITMMDKIAGNSSWNMAAGIIAAKEVGVQYPNANTVKLDHFIWSLSGMGSGSSLDTVNPGVFLAFSSTAKTKSYCDTQDVAADIPHTIDKIEGIISRDSGSCIPPNNNYEDSLC